jgi:hypothetical protein
MSHENEFQLGSHEEQTHQQAEEMSWIMGTEGHEHEQEEWMQSLSGVLSTAQNEKEIIQAIVHTALHMRGLDEHAQRLTPIIAEAAMADKAVYSSMLKLSDQVLKQTLQ